MVRGSSYSLLTTRAVDPSGLTNAVLMGRPFHAVLPVRRARDAHGSGLHEPGEVAERVVLGVPRDRAVGVHGDDAGAGVAAGVVGRAVRVEREVPGDDRLRPVAWH